MFRDRPTDVQEIRRLVFGEVTRKRTSHFSLTKKNHKRLSIDELVSLRGREDFFVFFFLLIAAVTTTSSFTCTAVHNIIRGYVPKRASISKQVPVKSNEFLYM